MRLLKRISGSPENRLTPIAIREEDEWEKAGGSGQPGRKQGDKEDKEDKEDKGQQPPFTLME